MKTLLRISIAQRIGAGYLAMAVLLLVSGTTGYLANSQLTGSIEYLTGPVNTTTSAVSEGIRGVQTQMLAVDTALRASLQEAQAQLAAGEQLTNKAFADIGAAGLLSNDQLESLRPRMQKFDAARQHLLQIDADYRDVYQRLQRTAANSNELLMHAEGVAGEQLLNAQWNSEGGSNNDDARDSEEWQITSASNDGRLALLNRMFNLSLLLKDPQNKRFAEEAEMSFGDLSYFMQQVGNSALLKDKKFVQGDLSGMSFSQATGVLIKDNEQLFRALLERQAQLRQAREDYRLAAEGLMQRARDIEAASSSAIERELASAASAASSSSITLFGVLAVGLLLALSFYWLSLQSIATPIRRLAERLQDIAEGDGDLTVSLDEDRHDELGRVSRSFNQFTGKIRHTIEQVQNAVAHLNASSENLQNTTAANIDRIRAQQNDTQDVATSVVELSSSMDGVADAAQNALQNANQANDQAASGQQQVSATVNSIQQLASQVEDANATILQLAQDSDAIGGVLDVIGGIAEQTNLLALNAAIEAARAGEQGRGFAVVADEVRTLASRTQQSTAEIQGMIDRLQQGARKAAGKMDESRACAQTTLEQGSTTGETFSNIVTAVSSIQGVNQQIAVAVDEQRANTEGVSRSVANISQSASEIVNGSSEIREASDSLSQVSGQLQQIVQQFRI